MYNQRREILFNVTFATAALFIASAVLSDGWPFNALFDSRSTVKPPVAIPKLQRSLKSKLEKLEKLAQLAQEAITASSRASALDILEVTDAHSTRTVLPIFLTPTWVLTPF